MIRDFDPATKNLRNSYQSLDGTFRNSRSFSHATCPHTFRPTPTFIREWTKMMEQVGKAAKRGLPPCLLLLPHGPHGDFIASSPSSSRAQIVSCGAHAHMDGSFGTFEHGWTEVRMTHVAAHEGKVVCLAPCRILNQGPRRNRHQTFIHTSPGFHCHWTCM